MHRPNRSQLFDSIRCIATRFEEDTNESSKISANDQRYYVHKDDVHNMVCAIIKLHLNPGKNIHNPGDIPRKVKMIAVLIPVHAKQWITSPSLQNDSGAVDAVTEWKVERYIYMSSSVFIGDIMEYYRSHIENQRKIDPEMGFNDKNEKDISHCGPYIATDYENLIL